MFLINYSHYILQGIDSQCSRIKFWVSLHVSNHHCVFLLCIVEYFSQRPECKIADLNLAAACHHAIHWEAGRAPSSGTLGTLGMGQGHAEPFRSSERNTSSTGLYPWALHQDTKPHSTWPFLVFWHTILLPAGC